MNLSDINPFAGLFTATPGAATPDQVARKRALIAAMMPQFGNANSVGAGIGQLATGILMGRRNRQLDTAESAGQASATDLFSRIMAGASAPSGAPLSVLGAAPMSAPANPNDPARIGADALAAIGKGPLTTDTVVSGLTARGMPEHVANGFAMNFQDESALNPTAVGDNGNAYGLAQWNGPRKAALESYAASQGKSASDPNVQMDFLMTELQGPESAAWSKISATNDPQSAAVAVLNSFERPAEAYRAQREAAYSGGNPITMSTQGQPDTGVGLNELYGALGNPWMNDQQRSVITAMIQQKTQDADPLRQLELQKAQLEYQRMLNSPAGDIPTSFAAMDMQAKAAGLRPGTPEYQNFMLNGGGMGQTPPAAFQALDMQAKAAGFAPGTDEYKKFMATKGAGDVAAAKAMGEASAGAALSLPGARSTADIVGQQVTDLLNDPYLPSMLGPMDSRLPNVSADAARVQAKIDQIQGGAFLQARQLLKGGGAITDYEGAKAEAAFVRMNQAQSVEDFSAALREFNAAVQDGVAKLEAQAGGQSVGSAPSAQPAPGSQTMPQADDPLGLFK